MSRARFWSRFWRETLIAVPLFLILVALGTWQLQRLAWKNQLLDELRTGVEAPAQPYLRGTPPEFQHLVVTGHLRADKPLYLYARTKDGVAGVHVFAALDREGAPLLVDRGFVPLPIDPNLATAPDSEAAVTGIVRISTAKKWFEPANEPAKNEWYWADLPAMAAALDLPAPLPFFLEATDPTGASAPQPTGRLILANVRNEHLQYALTWFALGGILVAFYVASLIAGRKKPQ